MNLAQAQSLFIAALAKNRDEENHLAIADCLQALECLATYFGNVRIATITPERLRDFLARWYVEEATIKTQRRNTDFSITDSVPHLPDAEILIKSLIAFFNWHGESFNDPLNQQRLAVLNELQSTLRRAIAINLALSNYLTTRGGAIQFPEFLTSFEAGGHSEYDVGANGEVCAREGYFRILRIDGEKVEAEELISETRVFPIIFPENIARWLEVAYLINLEIVHTPEGWQITNCGFAYPPNTES
ncbi:MAG: hypothetical protein AB1757_29040 [Acidobacteriota bacterium]